MARTTSILTFGLLVACGCGVVSPRPKESVDCSVENDYDFKTLFNFSNHGNVSDWFSFGDNTPNGDLTMQLVPNAAPRCGDTAYMELRASGHNFYGVGFGDWATNNDGVNGTGYEGIAFWARSPVTTARAPDSGLASGGDRTFMLYVDDGRTWVKRLTDSGGLLLPVNLGAGDQDLDGDGFMGPGDIFGNTKCRIPPIQALGDPACYHGGVLAPGSPTRVPAPDECGNQFHTYITTTENWQLFLVPWNQLVQWPCPNRLEGGINEADIRQIEIKLLQGTNYDILVDNFAFYRRRADAGD